MITLSSTKINVGQLKIQTFFGPNSTTGEQKVYFPEAFENTCISVIVTTRNGASTIPNYDVRAYQKDSFIMRASENNIATYVTAIGY